MKISFFSDRASTVRRCSLAGMLRRCCPLMTLMQTRSAHCSDTHLCIALRSCLTLKLPLQAKMANKIVDNIYRGFLEKVNCFRSALDAPCRFGLIPGSPTPRWRRGAGRAWRPCVRWRRAGGRSCPMLEKALAMSCKQHRQAIMI